MKRYLTFAVMAIAMLLSVASCKKETANDPELVAGPGEFVATIASNSIQNAPDFGGGKNSTKATINSSRQVIWQNNDAIKINGVTFTCGTVTTSEATFTKDVNSSETVSQPFNALYGCTVTGTGNSATYSIPASMTYDANNLANNLPMYAYSTDYYLTFHNICAALKVVIPANQSVDHIVISNDNLALNGAFTVSDQATESPKLTMTNTSNLTSAEKTTTVNVNLSSPTSESYVYIPVPAGTYTNFKIDVYYSSSSSTADFSKTIPTFAPAVNRIYTAKLEENYFCITNTGSANASIQLGTYSGNPAPNVYLVYSTDNGTIWNTFVEASTRNTVSLPANGKMYIKAGKIVSGSVTNVTNSTMAGYNGNYLNSNQFKITGSAVDLSGNIMYLLNPTGLNNMNPRYTFTLLFRNCTTIVNAENLLLPATYLEYDSYGHMFEDCTNLETAPRLPANTSEDWCYGEMFYNCPKLKSVTMLATNLFMYDDGLAHGSLYSWLSGSGTSVTNPTLYISNSITDITTAGSVGKFISDNTPSNWTIRNENGTLLR